MGAKLSNSETLAAGDFATDFICYHQNTDIQIVPALANGISHFINLAHLPQELVPQLVVVGICTGIQDSVAQALFAFIASQLLD